MDMDRDRDNLKPILESLIFASDSPISLEKLVSIIEGASKDGIKEALGELIEELRAKNSGILIEEVAGGFQFRTNPENAQWIRRLFKIGLQKISKAAMETLAVIAYRQPATRAEIESIRGVDSGGVLATLMEKRFIKIVGRKEAPGRPVVYGTTKEFLETFDLKDLSCLPSLKDIQIMEEEHAREQAVSEIESNKERSVEDVGGSAGEEGVHDEGDDAVKPVIQGGEEGVHGEGEDVVEPDIQDGSEKRSVERSTADTAAESGSGEGHDIGEPDAGDDEERASSGESASEKRAGIQKGSARHGGDETEDRKEPVKDARTEGPGGQGPSEAPEDNSSGWSDIEEEG